jgi:hypothetical protein
VCGGVDPIEGVLRERVLFFPEPGLHLVRAVYG